MRRREEEEKAGKLQDKDRKFGERFLRRRRKERNRQREPSYILTEKLQRRELLLRNPRILLQLYSRVEIDQSTFEKKRVRKGRGKLTSTFLNAVIVRKTSLRRLIGSPRRTSDVLHPLRSVATPFESEKDTDL